MKVLDPKIHGVLDYALAFAFLLAPALFDFPEPAATLSYVIGFVYIGTSLLTRYPLGLLKWIPFPVHGTLESIMAVGFIVFPWLFGFADVPAPRNFYVVAGVGLLGVVAITDYRGRGTAPTQSSGDIRHA
ncbi:MAG TPA: hypothetical protein VGO84_12335 [Burkholderiales bacterium]|nr:hypothetical protein [Burkholderiales bacterium]